jgi:hypothetical protein
MQEIARITTRNILKQFRHEFRPYEVKAMTKIASIEIPINYLNMVDQMKSSNKEFK